MTTTFAQKLLARAEELEQDAAALRRAAQVMNGHAVEGKRNGIAATIAGAVKLRARQQPETNGNGHGALPQEQPLRHAKAADVETSIISFLQDGPQSSAAIRDHLAGYGYDRGQARVGQLLKELRRKRAVATIGASQATRWSLATSKPADTPPADEALSEYATNRKRRAAKAEQILSILTQHGKPMKISELSAAAREQGIPSLTGIKGLVIKGLLTSRGKGPKRSYALAR